MRASTFTSKRVRLGVLVATLACAIAACGGTHPSSATVGGPMSAYTRQVLSDGRVTRAEHEAALAALFQCAKQAGLEPDATRKTARVIEVGLSSGPLRPGESQAAYDKRTTADEDRCLHDYWNDIDEAFVRATAPSEQERKAAVAALSTCEVRNGEQAVHNDADVRAMQVRLGDAMSKHAGLNDPHDAAVARYDAQMACMSTYMDATSSGQ